MTFIVPTVGRPSLERALQSIHDQTDDDYEVVVVFDGHKPNMESADKRLWLLHTEKGNAGETRNVGLDWFGSNGESEWVAFLDDDDYLLPTYVEHLRESAEDHPWADMVVSRMKHPVWGTLPLPGGELRRGLVGISFAIRSRLVMHGGLRFVKERVAERFHEDWEMISAVQKTGKIYLSTHCDYMCREATPDE